MLEKLTPIYNGRIVKLNLEQVRLPTGQLADLEIAHHAGGAAVVALDAVDRVCIVNQFRHAAGGWLLELPAGKIDGGEPPLETARRELSEEAGRRAQDWQALGEYLSSPGFLTERIHLFLARQLADVPPDLEPHEVLEAGWVPFDEALAMALDGRISDGKSIVGLCRAAAYLGRV
jgi:ADP-ribose pyrophosphatase